MFVQSDFDVAPAASSAVFVILLNKSTQDPVDSLPLKAYPETYFSVAITSSTDGLSGPPLDKIKDMSQFALQPCV